MQRKWKNVERTGWNGGAKKFGIFTRDSNQQILPKRLFRWKDSLHFQGTLKWFHFSHFLEMFSMHILLFSFLSVLLPQTNFPNWLHEKLYIRFSCARRISLDTKRIYFMREIKTKGNNSQFSDGKNVKNPKLKTVRAYNCMEKRRKLIVTNLVRMV